ncbi:BRO-N domain-containing protein [Pedobacter nyackensis]|uniref:BRO family, N-terminal domain n=1 Tax=Pedobacter nyackensis TaxID=475255 RepID=A0A1W2F9P8_9SPHI|nr:Bro-N domain-containing protein [Pedobacter nyackensis]SMD18641.1 BRO family, N-terminal domain [Pedobacter nyackensis]
MDIKLFESKRIRSQWRETDQKWYFSIIDVVEVLTESPRPRKYWNALKTKLRDEGSQLSQFLGQLKMKAEDGKMRKTDVADTEQLLRLIQSIPSPKAEPFKTWLAKVGYERMQEISDPEQSLDRARENWQKAGRSEKWIQQRMSGQETRNKLTDYWQEHGVQKGDEFALLTNIIHQEWTGMTVKTHKDIKALEKQNLRDHMTEAELLFTALAELSTRQIAESDEAEGLKENAIAFCAKP